MADELVLMATAREDIACANCGETLPNTVRLYYNNTTGKLEVQMQCQCQNSGDDGDAYQEESDVALTAK